MLVIGLWIHFAALRNQISAFVTLSRAPIYESSNIARQKFSDYSRPVRDSSERAKFVPTPSSMCQPFSESRWRMFQFNHRIFATTPR